MLEEQPECVDRLFNCIEQALKYREQRESIVELYLMSLSVWEGYLIDGILDHLKSSIKAERA